MKHFTQVNKLTIAELCREETIQAEQIMEELAD